MNRDLLKLSPAIEAQLRAQTREQMISMGVPAHLVSTIVDIGFHAADSAGEKLCEVVDRLPDAASYSTAFSLAVGLMLANMKRAEDALKEMSKRSGCLSGHLVLDSEARAHG